MALCDSVPCFVLEERKIVWKKKKMLKEKGDALAELMGRLQVSTLTLGGTPFEVI